LSFLLFFNVFSCTKKLAPPILPKQTLDEKIEPEFQKLLNQYFSKNFLDTEPLTVFVVTNRRATEKDFSCKENAFGVLRGEEIKFGACKVIVPKNHRVGEITFAAKKDESLDDVFKIIKEQSLQEQELISMLQNNNRTPLVFVHGFNVDYKESLLRASQIAYDLKYQGPIIIFTWPAGSGSDATEGIMINKTYDKNFYQAKNSIDDFKNFLLLLQKNEIRVNLLVHSMGHQIVLPALDSLAKNELQNQAVESLSEIKNNQQDKGDQKNLLQKNYENRAKIFVNNLILNAPDFENEKFLSILPNIKTISNRITLYCSSNDKAIIASKIMNNNSRAGSCLYSLELDTIDVSHIDDSIISLGHSYYSSRAVLADVAQTFLGLDIKQRMFMSKRRVKSDQNKYFLRP